MRFLFSFAFLLFNFPANAEFVQNYSFPITHSLKSTIAAAGIAPPKSAVNETIRVSVLDRRENRERRDLKLRLYPSAGRKLVFILAGLGSNADTPLAQFLAAHVQSHGVSAIVVPNTMTADFVLGASSSGIVGDVKADSHDTYRALQATIATLKKNGRLENEFSIIGYSMGALIAARVHEIDSIERRIGFQSALLINPPVSLLHGMRILDSYYTQFKSMGLGSKMGMASKIKKFLQLLGIAPVEAEAQDMSDRELQAAIGYAMRSGLSEMVLATQNIRDLGILPEFAEDRASAAKRIGFEQYVSDFLIPVLNVAGATHALQSMNNEGNLTSQAEFFANAQNIFVLHNLDDFLLSMPEIQWIEAAFGRRARIYPRGGHLGNLNHEDNLRAIGNWLQNHPIN